MATEHIYHKINPVDMPEIRALRSEYIRGFRFKSKVDRIDKITWAILPDIDWNKLGLKADDQCYMTEEITDVENEISAARDKLKSKLEYILADLSHEIINDKDFDYDFEKYDAPKEHLKDVARDMARKYHQRSTKPGRRHQRNSKSSKKTAKDAQNIATPSSNTPSKLPSKSPPNPQPKSPPRAQQVTRPSPLKSAIKTHQTTQGQPTTCSTKAPNSIKSQSMPTKHTTHKTIRGAVNASTKSNIKSYFKTTKSIKLTK